MMRIATVSMKTGLTVLLASVTVLVGCEKVPLTAPTDSTIALSVDKSTLPLNGTATVTAVVTESAGTAVHNGTSVSFSANLGRFEPIEAKTVNGRATTTFHAGSISGTTNINAFSGGASTSGAGTTAGSGIEVKIGAAAAGSIALQVVPSTVSQNGGTVSATALVLDTSGNPLPGVPVLFATDVGTLSNATVISDANGFATTNLVTTRTSVITARAGTVTPVTFTVAVSLAPTVTITSNTSSPTAGSPVAFTVTPSTAANASPIASVVVDFGDGTTEVLPAITGPVGLTHVYSRQGGYTVTATAIDITGGRGVSSVSVIVGFESIPTVSLSVSPNPVPPASQGLTTFTVTANAGAGGAPIRSVRVTLADGTVIYSGTGGGTFAYRFGGSGTYTVTAVATDASGATATTTTVVVVQPW